MRKALVLALTFILIQACAPVRQPRDTDEIAEAVFTYQLTTQISNPAEKPFFVFMPDRTDPSEKLLGKLRDLKFVVKPLSSSFLDKFAPQDKDTKETGIIIGVMSVQWKGDTECEVEGNIFMNTANSEDWRYEITRENGKWKIKSAIRFGVT